MSNINYTIELWKQCAIDLSYYNAAEGDSWDKEKVNRHACQKTYDKLCIVLGDELVSKLKSEGNYLVD